MSQTTIQIACPGGELTRGTLSHNPVDVRCRVDGLIQKAEGSPCVDSMCYINCPIWQRAREVEWAHKKLGAAEMIHAGQ